MSREAGTGDHGVYTISPEIIGEDNASLKARKHYVGVEAVSWFVNKESSWFSKRMVSGTLEIQLASGLETYHAALGLFALKGGARFAPVFQKPVLPDRNYRGGPLTFKANLTAIRRDTVVGSLLKSAANASLGIVAGMVETAALTGPAQLLTAAGSDLIGGVREILGGSSEGREPLFDDAGLEVSLQPSDIEGPAVFVLLHRGSSLDDQRLEVRTSGEVLLPFHRGAVLEDGAWLLLRIRRSDEYPNVRAWFQDAQLLRGRVSDLVSDVQDGIIDRQEALEEFKPTDRGDKTLFDEYMRLRAVIRSDGVLTEREATSYVGQMRAQVTQARSLIEQASDDALKLSIEAMTTSMVAGERLTGPFAEAFSEEAESIMALRTPSLVTSAEGAVADLSGNALFENMRYVPNTIALSV